MTLSRFFEVMTPFVFGGSSATEVERALGECASGTTRLALYPRLVRAQHEEALRALMPRLVRALEAVEPGRFAALMGSFLDRYASRGRSPVELAPGFARFLEEEGHDIEPWVVELADYAALRLEVGALDPVDPLTALPPQLAELELSPSLRVRRYTHDVVRGVSVPERRMVDIIVFSCPSTYRARALVVTPMTLVALGVCSGEIPEAALVGSAVKVDELRVRLARLGKVGALRLRST